MKAFAILAATALLSLTATAQSIYNPQHTIPTGYHGSIEAGYGVGVGDFAFDRLEFSTTHGYQINPWIYAGAGMGVHYYHDNDAWNIPIYADIRGLLPTASRFSPFLDFKVGYSVHDVVGFYFAPSVGVRYALSGKKGLSLSMGYELQKLKYDWVIIDTNTWDWIGGTGSCTAGAITFKLAFDF